MWWYALETLKNRKLGQGKRDATLLHTGIYLKPACLLPLGSRGVLMALGLLFADSLISWEAFSA